MAIYDVEDLLDIEIEDGDYDTISGFIVERLGKVPTDQDKGKIIETDDVVYKIESVKDKHIAKVKACKTNKDEDEKKEEK